MNTHSEGRQRSQAGQDEQRDDAKSEFGITLADAGRLLRKAKRVWIMYRVGPGEQNAIFAIPKSVVINEIKFYQGGEKTYRPAELDFTTHDGPTLIFGSHLANEHASLSRQPGMT